MRTSQKAEVDIDQFERGDLRRNQKRRHQKGREVEKVLRDYSRRIPGIRQLSYWERLKAMSMNSEQRRLERYKIIYIWKIMQGSVPNCGLNWTKTEERRGRMCEVPKLKGGSAVQKLRRQSFQMSGPKLWNALPRNLRNVEYCSLEQFKELLDSSRVEKVRGMPHQNLPKDNIQL